MPLPETTGGQLAELVEIEVVDDAGHMVHLEAPAAVLAVLERQLRAG
jgi:pimeloyl-ACP methyl ester carboxylesterase